MTNRQTSFLIILVWILWLVALCFSMQNSIVIGIGVWASGLLLALFGVVKLVSLSWKDKPIATHPSNKQR